MSSEETKPKIDDTETEEDKSSQDEAEPDRKVEASELKKDEEKNDDDSAAKSAEVTDGDAETEEDNEVKKPAKKRPVKSNDESKEEDKDSEEEDEDEDGEGADDVDEDEKKNGVGAKSRKKADKKDDDKKEKKDEVEIPDGKGTAFGECPRIEHFIKQREVDQLKKLHLVCFGKTGKPDQIKENLLKFKGFDYEPESDAYAKKKQVVAKLDFKHIKEICEIVDIEKKGKKDDLVTRIMDFLMEPKDSGKPVPAVPPPRPKRSSAVKANNRGYAGLDSDDDEEGGRRGRATGRRNKARPSYKDESSSEEDRRGRGRPGRKFSDSDAESEPELTPSESDSDSPKKKKVAPVKGRGRGAPKKKATPAKAPKRAAAKRGKKKDSEDESDPQSESEDEPLQKKSKKFPSDEEIKKYVKQILDGANLEEITMKTVCKQVYGRYPEHDLTHKKDLIKSTVKSLIAT